MAPRRKAGDARAAWLVGLMCLCCIHLDAEGLQYSEIPALEQLKPFISEVEHLNKRKIAFKDLATGDNGGTDCVSQSEIVIYINPRLPEKWKTSVLAHELGHAYLCSQGFKSWRGAPTEMGRRQPKNLIDDEGNMLVSCYNDPPADRVARKHGFDPSYTVDNSATKLVMPQSQVHASVQQSGRFWAGYAATLIYCREKRKHSFDDSKFEAPYVSEPLIAEILKTLRTGLESAGCQTPDACFKSAKKLRKLAGFDDYIIFENPVTGKHE